MFGFFRSSRDRQKARRLYTAILARARDPLFYEDFQVPDTLDGRFDMVALHVFLVLRRLKRDRPETADLSQALFDLMFVDMDENLRELGVGDLAVGRRVKDMAKAFMGRLAAYEEALEEGDDEALAAALRRNLFRGTSPATDRVAAMATYIRRQDQGLAATALATLTGGERLFPPVAGAERRAEG